MNRIKNFAKLYLKDSLIVIIGTLLSSAFAFLVQMLMARNLSVESYGLFTAQLTFLNFLTPCIGLGISAFWLKIYGKDKNTALMWMPISLKLLILTSILVFAVITINAISFTQASYVIALLFGFHCFGQSVVELGGARYQIIFDYKSFSLIQFLPHFMRFVFVGVLIILGMSDLSSFILAYALTGFLIIVFFGKKLFSFLSQKPIKHFQIELSTLLKNTLPFWLAGFFYIVYVQSSILILNYLKGPEKTGYYSSAFLFLTAIYMLPSVIYQKLLLPKLHSWAYHDKDKILTAYRIGNKVMVVSGSLIALALYLLSDIIIETILGTKFAYSALVLKILALAIPLKFVSSSVGALLSTKEFMPIKVKIMFLASIFNVAMNFIFIYYFSVIGAAIVTVLTELILMILMLGTYKFQYEKQL